MIQQIKAYIKKEIREMSLALLCLMIISIGFMLYLKFIGLPMSRAHNLYNQALLAIDNNEYERALELIDGSLSYWEDQKVLKLQQEINNTH